MADLDDSLASGSRSSSGAEPGAAANGELKLCGRCRRPSCDAACMTAGALEGLHAPRQPRARDAHVMVGVGQGPLQRAGCRGRSRSGRRRRPGRRGAPAPPPPPPPPPRGETSRRFCGTSGSSMHSSEFLFGSQDFKFRKVGTLANWPGWRVLFKSTLESAGPVERVAAAAAHGTVVAARRVRSEHSRIAPGRRGPGSCRL